MDVGYFNFSSKVAKGWLDRSGFVRHWWHLYLQDPHWVPPYYPAFRRSLEPDHNSHLGRLEPTFLSIEAMPHRQASRRSLRTSELDLSPFGLAAFEQTVATALLLRDSRRRDRTAYIAQLHCTNDAECLERFLDTAAIQLSEEGFNRLVTLSSLSPYLGSGFLQNHWDRTPPLGTPYDPPYLLELVESQLNPGVESCLYYLDVTSELPTVHGISELEPLDPPRLVEDLLPLFAAGLPDQGDFPAPDPIEARFLLMWVGVWPIEAWLARVDTKEVGFVLLGPDIAPALRRAKGGRGLLSRLWLSSASRRPFRQGRLFFGGVLSDYRQKGIGKQLLRKALTSAREHGWERLVIGPVLVDSSTARFLERAGALREASYRDYSLEI